MSGATAASALHVWVLSDGQPGHYNLSRGLLAALARERKLEIHWLDVRLRFGLARNLLRFALNRLPVLPTALLRLFYRMPPLPRAPCDLVVSAGGKTSFINAWLARRRRAKNLFFGSLRRLSPALFSLVVTLEPLLPAAANNLVLDLPPSAIDSDALAVGDTAIGAASADAARPLWLLMIGGDGAGYRYADADWKQLGILANRLAQQYGIRWLLLGSRRTGAAAESCLQATVDSPHVATACWYAQAADDAVEACLGAARRIFVTEDSMTMLTEAIHSQRPVFSLSPRSVASTARYEAMLQKFADRGWLTRYAIDELAAAPQRLAAGVAEGLKVSPQAALAAQLVDRLGL